MTCKYSKRTHLMAMSPFLAPVREALIAQPLPTGAVYSIQIPIQMRKNNRCQERVMRRKAMCDIKMETRLLEVGTGVHAWFQNIEKLAGIDQNTSSLLTSYAVPENALQAFGRGKNQCFFLAINPLNNNDWLSQRCALVQCGVTDYFLIGFKAYSTCLVL